MKRCMGFVVVLGLAGIALAQAPFTIVRPADGAKVREVVRVQVPKGSLAEGNFVGVYVDGKFVEATILDEKGDYYEYLLNTKASKIPDGAHKLELVKYAEAGDKARIMDRTSVTVIVVNSASIPVPEDGFLLRYKWVRGKQLVYNTEIRAAINTISENQARYGGRAAELPIDTDRFRYLYSVDNTYGNGDGLVRMQVMPAAGKNYIFFKLLRSSTGDLEEGVKHNETEMYPAYMRLTNTGNEVFGSVPIYVGLMGTASEEQVGLVYVLPMPPLPDKPIKPGSPFPSKFQLSSLDQDTMHLTNTLIDRVPARGEFVGVEWEGGHPCAKLRYSISAQIRKAKAGTETKEGMGGEKVSLEQTVFFAMDLGVPLKMETDETVDFRGAISTGGNNRGNMGQPGNFGGDDGGMFRTGPINIRSAGQKGPGGLPRPGGAPGGGEMTPNTGQGGQTGRMGGPAGGTAQNQFLRLRTKITQTLVQ